MINVARYYYHQTVQVNGNVDDTRDNVCRGFDVTQLINYRLIRSDNFTNTSNTVDKARIDRSMSSVGRKRSSSYADATLPPSKRTYSSSPTKGEFGYIL